MSKHHIAKCICPNYKIYSTKLKIENWNPQTKRVSWRFHPGTGRLCSWEHLQDWQVTIYIIWNISVNMSKHGAIFWNCQRTAVRLTGQNHFFENLSNSSLRYSFWYQALGNLWIVLKLRCLTYFETVSSVRLTADKITSV